MALLAAGGMTLEIVSDAEKRRGLPAERGYV